MGATLREVISGGYQEFNLMAPEKKKSHILAVQYAEMLSVTTNAKADNWDIFQVLGTGKGKELVTEKNEINRRFFEHMSKVKGDTPSDFIDIEPKIAADIAKYGKELSSQTLRKLRDTVSLNLADAASHHNRLERCLGLARKAQIDLEVAEKSVNGDAVAEEMRAIAKNPFYRFHSYDTAFKRIFFVTADDIILTHKNLAAGIDLRVNFGRLKVSIDILSGAVFVSRHEKNLDYSGFYHPHINAAGKICWGNAMNTALDLLAKAKYSELFNILASNLTNYNDANPYVALGTFQSLRPEDKPGVQTPKTISRPDRVSICPECRHREGQCECGCDEEWISVCSECEDESCDCGHCSDCGNAIEDCSCVDEIEEEEEEEESDETEEEESEEST